MAMLRRRFLQASAAAAVLAASRRSAWALDYPTRPVRILVGFPPGQAADLAVRLIAQRLAERLGQPFIVENRPGAGTNIATEAVVHAAPDGYTLLCAAAPNVINATLYRLKFDFVRDMAPVGSLVRVPFVLLVNPSLPVRDVSELIAYGKAKPDALSYASSGIGTVNHMAGELFKVMTDIEMTHVPYKGTVPALTDLLGGRVQVMFADMSALEYVTDGKLRALAVTTAARLDQLPDVRTVGETVAGFEVSGFLGIAAPAGISSEIVAKLNGEINSALADRAFRTQLRTMGYREFVGSPAEFRKFIAAETEKWGGVIRARGIKPA
jgi:tripartite-type tricarboxylate transporter receptor subunit TctC